MTYEGVPHARQQMHKNGNVTYNCKHNRRKSACTHKVRENEQGDFKKTGSHDPSFFKKNDEKLILMTMRKGLYAW